jgi:MoaA/NifB/PqqE/SkfB family radical SAM enzyme
MTDLEIVNDALKELSTQYEVLGELVDLSLLELGDGKKKIFDLLEKVARPVFENNQRILVYQPSNDRYSYADNVASDSLIFLQKYLQTIDISNFFVTVISGNPNLKNELKWLQVTHSTDLNPMSCYYVDVAFKKNIPDQDTFCVNMWNHLFIGTQLDIVPCCVARLDRPLGNLTNQTLDEIVNSIESKEIRLKMLSGRRPIECENCHALEDRGLPSRRLRDNAKFNSKLDYFKSTTNDDGSLKVYTPETFDLRLNNICNLKCRTCSGAYSSELAYEEKKLFNNVVNFQKMSSSITRNKVLNSVIKYLDTAKSMYFAGGEPLIRKEHYDILDYLIAIGKTDLKIFYNTNFSILTFKDKNVLDYWKYFSNITIGASLDGHGRIFEYVRHGAKWNIIEKNLLDLQTHCPHVNFTVNSTISLLSVESVIELQQIWHKSKKLHIKNFEINPVMSNDFLTLSSLLPHHKKKISQQIDQHCQWLFDNDATDLANSWKQIQQAMWTEDNSYVNKEFAWVNRARDIERNENFESTYPIFSDLFAPYYNNTPL